MSSCGSAPGFPKRSGLTDSRRHVLHTRANLVLDRLSLAAESPRLSNVYL